MLRADARRTRQRMGRPGHAAPARYGLANIGALTMADLASVLRSIATRLPDVEQGIACKGTALESVTYQVRKKAFLFVGPKAARLKLDQSLGDARKLAA